MTKKEKTEEANIHAKVHAGVAAAAIVFLACWKVHDIAPTQDGWMQYALPIVLVFVLVGEFLWGMSKK